MGTIKNLIYKLEMGLLNSEQAIVKLSALQSDFNNLTDIRQSLLNHPDSEMVTNSCLHFLGDDAQEWYNNKDEPENVDYKFAIKIFEQEENRKMNNSIKDTRIVAAIQVGISYANGKRKLTK